MCVPALTRVRAVVSLSAPTQGERLLRVPELKDKDICFLANHGTLQISSSIEEALFDCFNVERLCKEQVHAMMYASPFRELSSPQIATMRGAYERTRASMVTNYYDKQVGAADANARAWCPCPRRAKTASHARPPGPPLACITTDTRRCGRIPSSDRCPARGTARARCRSPLASTPTAPAATSSRRRLARSPMRRPRPNRAT